MTEFFETRMGQRFYEHTVPELVRQLERLNENIERSLEAAERIPTTPISKGDHPDDHDQEEDPTYP